MNINVRLSKNFTTQLNKLNEKYNRFRNIFLSCLCITRMEKS